MIKFVVGAAVALVITATTANAAVLLPAPPRGETWTYEITGTFGEISELIAISDYYWGWDVPDTDFPGEWLTYYGDAFLSAGGPLNGGSTKTAWGGSISAALGIVPGTSTLRARVSNRLPQNYNVCGTGAYFCAVVFSPLQVALFGDAQGTQVTVTSMSAVPEPATWAMMIAGFGAVGSAVRKARRRRNAAATT